MPKGPGNLNFPPGGKEKSKVEAQLATINGLYSQLGEKVRAAGLAPEDLPDGAWKKANEAIDASRKLAEQYSQESDPVEKTKIVAALEPYRIVLSGSVARTIEKRIKEVLKEKGVAPALHTEPAPASFDAEAQAELAELVHTEERGEVERLQKEIAELKLNLPRFAPDGKIAQSLKAKIAKSQARLDALQTPGTETAQDVTAAENAQESVTPEVASENIQTNTAENQIPSLEELEPSAKDAYQNELIAGLANKPVGEAAPLAGDATPAAETSFEESLAAIKARNKARERGEEIPAWAVDRNASAGSEEGEKARLIAQMQENAGVTTPAPEVVPEELPGADLSGIDARMAAAIESMNTAGPDAEQDRTPTEWKDRLTNLILDAERKEKEKPSRFERIKGFFSNRSSEQAEKAKELEEATTAETGKSSGLERWFRGVGEKYNKVGFKTKLAVGLTLSIGFGAALSFGSLPATIALIGAIGAQRTAGLASMFLKYEKTTQEGKWQKEKAMAKAIGHSALMTGGMMLLSHEARDLFDWMREHQAPTEHPTAESQSLGAATTASPIEHAAPAAQPMQAELTPNASIEVPTIGASTHGYEGMLKDLWHQMQGHPANAPEGSDLDMLLKADAHSLDKVVSDLAAKHEFLHANGDSVIINTDAHMTVDAQGVVHLAQGGHDFVNASPDAAVTHLHAAAQGPAEFNADKYPDDDMWRQLGVEKHPEMMPAHDAAAPVTHEAAAPAQSPTGWVEKDIATPGKEFSLGIENQDPSLGSADWGVHNAPESGHWETTGQGSVGDVPQAHETWVAHTDHAVTPDHAAPESGASVPGVEHLTIDASQSHIYANAQGNVMVYGNDYTHTLNAAETYAKAHPGTPVWVQSENPVMVNGQPRPFIFQVVYRGIFGGGMQITGADAPISEAYIGAIDPNTFTSQLDK